MDERKYVISINVLKLEILLLYDFLPMLQFDHVLLFQNRTELRVRFQQQMGVQVECVLMVIVVWCQIMIRGVDHVRSKYVEKIDYTRVRIKFHQVANIAR